MAEYAPRPVKLVPATRALSELPFEPAPLEVYGGFPGAENLAQLTPLPSDAGLVEVIERVNRLVELLRNQNSEVGPR